MYGRWKEKQCHFLPWHTFADIESANIWGLWAWLIKADYAWGAISMTSLWRWRWWWWWWCLEERLYGQLLRSLVANKLLYERTKTEFLYVRQYLFLWSLQQEYDWHLRRRSTLVDPLDTCWSNQLWRVVVVQISIETVPVKRPFYYRIGLMSRVFTNGLGYRGSIPGRVIPKTKEWYRLA